MRSRGPNRYREVVCKECSKAFLTDHSQGKYCSDECRRIGARKSWVRYGIKNRLKRRRYYLKYYKSNRSMIIKKTTAYRLTKSGGIACRLSWKNQILNHPVKIGARVAVRAAKIKGQILQTPCEKCGNPDSQAHHPDYNKPLCVKWLCIACHQEEHHRLKGLVNDPA